jgi:hypothetical protein
MRFVNGVCLVGALSLAGCATTAIDSMNQGLSQAMGEPVSRLESALGQAVEVTVEVQTRDIAGSLNPTLSPVILK